MSNEAAIRAFLSDRNIQFKESGQSLITDCVNPSCKKEMHMYIRRTDGFSTCFKCGSRWGLRDLVSAIDHCDISEAAHRLGFRNIKDIQSYRLEFNDNNEDDDEYEEDEEFIKLSEDFIPIEDSRVGMNYLASRGIIDPSIIISFDLRWHETMQAVVFPIKTGDYVYGWQARKVNPGPDEPRLLTKTGMNKSNFLLNYDQAIKSKEIVLVEGPFDCIKVAQAGIGAVATFGSMVSNKQVELLLESGVMDLYNGIDPDAHKQADILSGKLLNDGKHRIFRMLPPSGKKDFGECSSEEIVLSRDEAIPITSKLSFLEFSLKET
jgi:DNA primase